MYDRLEEYGAVCTFILPKTVYTHEAGINSTSKESVAIAGTVVRREVVKATKMQIRG